MPVQYSRHARQEYFDPKMGSQARCLTISQHALKDEDLTGNGKVADKAKEIVSDIFGAHEISRTQLNTNQIRTLQRQIGPPALLLM